MVTEQLEIEKTYWENNGKYQSEYDLLYKEHVPDQGMSKTTTGEALRCISRFYYERFNNGHCNDKTYEIEFLNTWSYCNGLKLPKISENMSDEKLEVAVNVVISFLSGRATSLEN